MSKYRKRPVVVDAFQHDGSTQSADFIRSWVGKGCDDYWDGNGKGETVIRIQTLEGTMHAPKGWWIIRGIKGEFYPCDPEVFAATYELATAPTPDAATLQQQLDAANARAEAAEAERDDALFVLDVVRWAVANEGACAHSYIRDVIAVNLADPDRLRNDPVYKQLIEAAKMGNDPEVYPEVWADFAQAIDDHNRAARSTPAAEQRDTPPAAGEGE